MRSFLSFVLSLILSLLVFGAVGVGGFILWVEEPSPMHSENSNKENEFKVFEVLSVYTDYESSRYFASVVSFDLNTSQIVTQTVDCRVTLENGTQLYEIYEKEGLYPFVSALLRVSGKKDIPFVQFSSESFIKIADRCTKMMYNYKDTNALLLTGRQADEKLDNETFSLFCKILAEDALEKGIEREFLYYSAVCPNDFSYPDFYKLISN